MFVADRNAHHEEWFGSPMTTLHGRAAREFVSSLDCTQMVTVPTHIREGFLIRR